VRVLQKTTVPIAVISIAAMAFPTFCCLFARINIDINIAKIAASTIKKLYD
jgi:hypothetical protein